MRKRRNTPESFNVNKYKFGECCRNLWDEDCDNWDIAVYIRYKDEKRPICRKCWKEIANNGTEWG